MRHPRFKSKHLLFLVWTMVMHCYIISLSLSLSLTNRIQRVQNCDTHSRKGTYNTSFIPAALASCTFKITVQDPVSYVQSTEWDSTSISKPPDRKIYTSENPPI